MACVGPQGTTLFPSARALTGHRRPLQKRPRASEMAEVTDADPASAVPGPDAAEEAPMTLRELTAALNAEDVGDLCTGASHRG